MMTPLAKASGFLGNGALPVDAHRPHPGLESASQDIPSRVLVSVQGQTAVRANVLTHAKFLVYVFAATAALLACSPRIHRHHSDTGTFGLVSQDRQEAAPCGVRDCPAEPVVPDHSANVQAFYRDQSIATDQVQRSFMMMIAPLVSDVGMKNTDNIHGFASIRAALLLAADSALGATQGREFLLEKARVLDDLSVRSGEEVFEADVDTNSGQRARLNMHISEVAGQNDEPLVTFALERRRLDATFDGAVDLTADHADMLHAESVVVETDSVAVGWELDAIEAVPCFETRVSWSLSSLYSPEERDERLVETAHRGLGRREVEARKVNVVAAQIFELCRLVDVPHGMPMLPVGVAALLQAEVVETSVRFEHYVEFALLIGVREETEFEGAAHLLFLRDVPVGRSALCASEDLWFTRHPLVAAAQAFQFFDRHLHADMYITNNSRVNSRFSTIST